MDLCLQRRRGRVGSGSRTYVLLRCGQYYVGLDLVKGHCISEDEAFTGVLAHGRYQCRTLSANTCIELEMGSCIKESMLLYTQKDEVFPVTDTRRNASKYTAMTANGRLTPHPPVLHSPAPARSVNGRGCAPSRPLDSSDISRKTERPKRYIYAFKNGVTSAHIVQWLARSIVVAETHVRYV